MRPAARDQFSASAPPARDPDHHWRCSAAGGGGGALITARVQSLPRPSGSQPASQLGRRRSASRPRVLLRLCSAGRSPLPKHLAPSGNGPAKALPTRMPAKAFILVSCSTLPPDQAGWCCYRLVTKSHLTLCHPMDCSPPGSSVCGISQARILEWVAISFSRGSSRSRDRTHISCIGKLVLYH